jgi:hypothetical protein
MTLINRDSQSEEFSSLLYRKTYNLGFGASEEQRLYELYEQRKHKR